MAIKKKKPQGLPAIPPQEVDKLLASLPRHVEPEPKPEDKVDEPWEPEPAVSVAVQAVIERVETPLEAEARLVQSQAQAIISAMNEREPNREAAYALGIRMVQTAKKLQDMLRY